MYMNFLTKYGDMTKRKVKFISIGNFYKILKELFKIPSNWPKLRNADF